MMMDGDDRNKKKNQTRSRDELFLAPRMFLLIDLMCGYSSQTYSYSLYTEIAPTGEEMNWKNLRKKNNSFLEAGCAAVQIKNFLLLL